MEAFTRFLPPLSSSRYKGQAGKIAIIGGCFEYTGAPYFAGAAVLRFGGDLSHIFCAKSAATPIKSYAPEQIVHPYLPDNDEFQNIDIAVKKVMDWAPSMQSFVIGPGLGRNRATLDFTEKIIENLKSTDKPVILDGDAIFLVSEKPQIVNSCKRFILTPNGGEFIRLQNSLKLPKGCSCADIANALGGVTVFAKGKIDVVSNGQITKEFNFPSSKRRVGGQGDITAGALGLFAAWAPDNYFEAAAAASEAVRKAAVLAFSKKHRSTITSDIIDEICNTLPETWRKAEEDE
ncbi:ATP-dependent (S)-NAD(P)H-hydrate dehydratase isoform X2 [Histomonas meleagridis]|uniref:ATP-dependent (S)-NAD(P)H-hydrate dehydratase isoform X2 n=1 Tax=Histomonas meleagridis TaxID=135588 RepID=UPI0035599CCC|nr:ATP-dependent (S)-NAD(P)H-hydrate dehydratase isoform X2 [Histomonas meleagridis]KAH0802752.1 ATP-dependent (S)-NAD(P)H-hydrate dehydratase isoform X2 [Histomonas meleagridis]